MPPLGKNAQPANTAFLDGLRGLAAFVVMVGHARWLLWEGWGNSAAHRASHGPFGRLLMYVLVPFRFGHEMVVLFFVLSGFVIHLRYARGYVRDPGATFDLGAFWRRRARRIYPPLLFAMVVTFLCDVIGEHAGFGIYSGSTVYPLLNANIHASHDWWTALGNLSFLMGAYVPVWGTNGPLWSLMYEWWFYMLYPAVWFVARRSLLLGSAIVFGGCFVAVVFPGWPLRMPEQVLAGMGIWWLGAVLAEKEAGRLSVRWRSLGMFAVALLPAPFMRASPFADGVWGLGFFGLISILFALGEHHVTRRALGRLGWLGECSYTMYVIHFPLLVLLSGWLMSRSPSGTLPAHLGWVYGSIPVLVLFSYLAHYFVERPFVRSSRKPAREPSSAPALAA